MTDMLPTLLFSLEREVGGREARAWRGSPIPGWRPPGPRYPASSGPAAERWSGSRLPATVPTILMSGSREAEALGLEPDLQQAVQSTVQSVLSHLSSLSALDREPLLSSPEDRAPSERSVLTPLSDRLSSSILKQQQHQIKDFIFIFQLHFRRLKSSRLSFINWFASKLSLNQNALLYK